MRKRKLILAFFLVVLLALAVMPFGFAKKGGKSAEHRKYPVHPLMKIKGDGSSRPLHPSEMPDGRPRHPLGKVVPPIPDPDPEPTPDPKPEPSPEPTPELKPITLNTFQALGIIYSLALFFVVFWGLKKETS